MAVCCVYFIVDAAHESLVREPLDPSIAEMEQLDKAQHSPRSAL